MTDSANEQWSKLSLIVANEPDNFSNWENLVKYSSKGLSKVSSMSSLEHFRITNEQFLFKFPFMEQYWINYASAEFKLGHTDSAMLIFERSLDILPYSNIIWLEYLKLLKEVELDYGKLLSYYTRAEQRIGTHYHSYEFWKDFIELELSHNGKSIYYFNLLKKVVSIPIFNYSYFFKILFLEIDELTRDKLKKLVSDQELSKKLKLQLDQPASKINYHDLRSKLKKVFTDSYITTQYKSFEYHQFEKNIKLEYFVPGLIKSYQELSNWENYLSYMEKNGTDAQIEQLYNRALVPLQSYPQFWLKLSDFYLSKHQIQDAYQVLSKSLLFLHKSSLVDVQIKLIKIEVLLNNFIRAKDIIQVILQDILNNQDSQSPGDDICHQMLLEFVKIEKILNKNGPEAFKNFLVDLVKNHLSIDNSLLLMENIYSNFFHYEPLSDFIKVFSEDSRFKKKTKYWIILLNVSLSKYSDRSTLIGIYSEAVNNITDDLFLHQWYEVNLSYESSRKEELQTNFSESSKCLFN